jgi:putative transcriptional regulator
MKLGRKTGTQGGNDTATPGTKPDAPTTTAPTTTADATATGKTSVPKAGPRGKAAVERNAPRGDPGTPAIAKPSAGKPKLQRKSSKRGYLDGQMLIAMPTMGDDRFARSVIYMCAHSSEGAMGIIVNQPAPHISFPDLLVQLDVVAAAELIQLPPHAGGVRVLKGGPVETSRGFVLHSSDFFLENSTLPIDDGVCLTATLDILKAIAHGNGPKSAVLALGYAGWAPGQLESEINQNGWLHCAADSELIFGADTEAKYEKAFQKIGVDVGMLSSEAGHA